MIQIGIIFVMKKKIYIKMFLIESNLKLIKVKIIYFFKMELLKIKNIKKSDILFYSLKYLLILIIIDYIFID